MKIISPPQRREIPQHTLRFAYLDEPGSGFTFDCDEDGQVYEDTLSHTALQNLSDCRSGSVNDRPVRASLHHYTVTIYEPAVIRCDCGDVLHLETDCACLNCAQWYSEYGYRLAPPGQWGEETGETFGHNGQLIE